MYFQIVSHCAMKMTIAFSPVIGRLCDTYIAASLDKEWLTVLETVASIFKSTFTGVGVK